MLSLLLQNADFAVSVGARRSSRSFLSSKRPCCPVSSTTKIILTSQCGGFPFRKASGGCAMLSTQQLLPDTHLVLSSAGWHCH